MTESVVYAVAAGHMVKIGYTTDLTRRMKEIQSASPLRIDCLGTAPGGRPLEAALHRQFTGARRHGEWFEMTGVERVELRKRLAGAPVFIRLPRAGKDKMLPEYERERRKWAAIRRANKRRAKRNGLPPKKRAKS